MEVIDIHDLLCSKCLSGSEGCFCLRRAESANKVARIKSALSSCGFVLITNHGIPSQITDRAVQDAARFFCKDMDAKLQSRSKDRARRGYSPAATENFATLVGVRGADNDLVEKYRIGPMVTDDVKSQYPQYYSSKDGRVHFYENNRVELETELAGMVPYYHAVEHLAKQLLKLILLSAKYIDVSSLDAAVDKHTSILSANYYSPTNSVGANQLRVAAHTDVSLLTIVAQSAYLGDEAGGLEVLIRSSEGVECYMPVPYTKDALIVNVGDCLQYWSRGIFRSAMHRVVSKNTSTGGELTGVACGNTRTSLAFFYAPNYDAVLRWPVPTDAAETGVASADAGDELNYTQWRKNHIKHAMAQLKKGDD
jgi:isopenicillin N synthase-like dioxygenase